MAPIINRTTSSPLARGGESVLERQLQEKLVQLDAKLQEGLCKLRNPEKGFKYCGTFARPAGWQDPHWGRGVTVETPSRYVRLLELIESIQALGEHRSAPFRVGEDIPYPGLGGYFGPDYVLAQKWAVIDPQIHAVFSRGGAVVYERLFWAFKFDYLEEVVDKYFTTEPYFGATREVVGEGALVEFFIDQSYVSEAHAEILRAAKEVFPDFIWEDPNRGEVRPSSETDCLIKEAIKKGEVAKAEAKAKAEAEIARLRGQFRVYTRYNRGQGWVIAPDGTEREPDVIDTSWLGSNNKRLRQSAEGDYVWFDIKPDELVLAWRKAYTAAPHEFEVRQRPANLTPAQLSRVAELQEELEERFKGEFGLSSHKPSPPVGEGWGLLPENFREEEKEIDPSSPMAIAFAKAMARKS